MVCIHCGAIPESLLESELFGHVKDAQIRLLRILQERTITRDASFSLARALVRIKGWEYHEIRQVATSVMVSFPEDPRTTGLLLRLIDMDSEAGDRFGAHLLYRYLNTPDFIHANPVIAAAAIPLSFFTNGHRVPDDLADASPLALTNMMLRSKNESVRTRECI